MATFSNDISHISFIQNREDFIDKFYQQHNLSNRNSTSNSSSKGRWNYLHDLNKLQKAKLQEQREIKKKKEEEEMFSECTFNPKLNKSVNYGHSSILSRTNTIRGDNVNQSNLICETSMNLLDRQEMWKQTKRNRLKILKQIQSKKEFEQCHFQPEINRFDALNKSHIDKTAISLLEDPESYNQYLKRLAKKREEEENKRKRENSQPGSGNIWTPIKKKYNLTYDYTKHEITENCFPRSKSKVGLVKNKSTNKRYNIPMMDKDKYYDCIYNNKFNQKGLVNREVYGQSKPLFEKQIEYSQALDLLHKALYDFSLLDNDDEN